MSMLAEPRRKQRIGPNPRGKFFLEEEDNPGKSMLQKMGWKDGDGLGLQKQGISEPIRPKIQMSAKGLGFDVKSDPWVQHNQDFADVLKKLNEDQGEAVGSSESTESNKHELETKSKASRARIHYHKFVKGKDLSRASSTDLKSIFGNSAGTFESISMSNTEVAVSKAVTEDDPSAQINMGSMTDYFSKKMAERKKVEKHNTELEADDPESIHQNTESSNESEVLECDSPTPVLKKRKKTKVAKPELEANDSEPIVSSIQAIPEGSNESEILEDNATTPVLKKRKKSKAVKPELEANDSESILASIQAIPEGTNEAEILEDTATTPALKKRKKSKAVEPELEVVESSNESEVVVDAAPTQVTKKRKKTKTSNAAVDPTETESTTQKLESSNGPVVLEDAALAQVVKKRKKTKPKDEVAQDQDYAPNQINMGSMADYFSKKMAEREECRKKINTVTVLETDYTNSSKQKHESNNESEVVEDAAPTQVIKKRKKSKVINAELETEASSTLNQNAEPNNISEQLGDDDAPTEVLIKKRKKTKTAVTTESVADVTDSIPNTNTEEENLEERLKREMIALKVKKPKNLSHDAMLRICKRFPGANLDKVKGYAFY